MLVNIALVVAFYAVVFSVGYTWGAAQALGRNDWARCREREATTKDTKDMKGGEEEG